MVVGCAAGSGRVRRPRGAGGARAAAGSEGRPGRAQVTRGERVGANGQVVIGRVIIGEGLCREAARVERPLEGAVAHAGAPVRDEDRSQAAEESRDVLPLAPLRGIVRVHERRPDEARGTAVVAGHAVQPHAGAERRQGRVPPGGRRGLGLAQGQIVAQVDALPFEGGLVGEDVHVVLAHVHAVLHALHDDAAGPVADEPVEARHGQLVVHRLGNDRNVSQGLPNLFEAREVPRHPVRELVRGDVHGTRDGSLA